MSETIHVVGGGLVGALTTIFLAQHNYKVVLYERRPDMRKVKVDGGRSINLVLTARGMKALEAVGLHEAARELIVPVKGRMLHDMGGNTTLVPYGQTDEEVINSISRGGLNKLLLQKAGEYDNVEIVFNSRCVSYDPQTRALTMLSEETGKEQVIETQTIIGADGGGSALRKVMKEYISGFELSEDTLAHGYKELIIPAAENGDYQIEKHALHIWPRKNFMLMALPNLEGSFTVTLFLAHEGQESFASLETKEDAKAFFSKYFADAMAIMPSLAEDFVQNPTGFMTTVKCLPWHVEDKLMLIGDASHAIVPFFGQGMNSGFEDCTALGELLEKHGNDWATIFAALEKERKPNADAIADMALENFVEMRDTVADPKFQLKKQVGFELERRFPDKFIPKYAMVVFHPEIPYAEAKRRGEEQDKLLEALCGDAADIEEINWDKVADFY
ncbi:MAG: FAD-dependent oxidoreductase [Rickettsiales bacterium]